MSVKAIHVGVGKLTAADLEKGAVRVTRALWQTYRSVYGKLQNVNGDMTSVRCVPDLSPAVYRHLDNIEHTRRKLLGALAVRRTMHLTYKHIASGTAQLFVSRSRQMKLIACS